MQTYIQITQDSIDYLWLTSEALHHRADCTFGTCVFLQGAAGVLVCLAGVFGGPAHSAPDQALQTFLPLIAGAPVFVRGVEAIPGFRPERHTGIREECNIKYMEYI